MTLIKLLHKDAPLKLEWIRSFLAVADAGSFTKAARQLEISQPTISVHVKDLETNLGVRLFEHVGGRVRLSRSGEITASEGRKVLDGVRDFRTAVTESEDTVKGVLVLGASTTPGNYILPPIMSRFERQYPRAETVLSIGNSGRILTRLLANEVDLGMVGLRPPEEEFVSTPFCDDEIVVFSPKDHPLTRKRHVSPTELARHRLLVREADSATRRLADAWFTNHEVHPRTMALGSPETIKRAVAAGLGIGILSKHAITNEAGEQDFARLRVPGFPIRRGLFVVHLRKKRLTRTMKCFLELLESQKSRKS